MTAQLWNFLREHAHQPPLLDHAWQKAANIRRCAYYQASSVSTVRIQKEPVMQAIALATRLAASELKLIPTANPFHPSTLGASPGEAVAVGRSMGILLHERNAIELDSRGIEIYGNRGQWHTKFLRPLYQRLAADIAAPMGILLSSSQVDGAHYPPLTVSGETVLIALAHLFGFAALGMEAAVERLSPLVSHLPGVIPLGQDEKRLDRWICFATIPITLRAARTGQA